MIGYMLQQALKNHLPDREASVLLTQVEVDPQDPAFSNPTKYIGPVYSKEQADELVRDKGWSVKSRRGSISAAWCRHRSLNASSESGRHYGAYSA
ncbi:Carbamate kinase 1 [Cedecea neteri]|uniref:Carbamate kinase 1 n=1 Tax=Cedecea neteri TaxID=158822 RepID=A0A2X2T1F8_9ENTR|nr:Carbamate kinase 1 [Cedecea neteri]